MEKLQNSAKAKMLIV